MESKSEGAHDVEHGNTLLLDVILPVHARQGLEPAGFPHQVV